MKNHLSAELFQTREFSQAFGDAPEQASDSSQTRLIAGLLWPCPISRISHINQKLSEHKPRLNRYYHQKDPTHFQSPNPNCQQVPALHHNSSEEMAPSAQSLPRYKPRTMHREITLLSCAPCLFFSSWEYHTLCLTTWRVWHNAHPAWRWISIPTATHETEMTGLTNVLEETSPLLSGNLMYIYIYMVSCLRTNIAPFLSTEPPASDKYPGLTSSQSLVQNLYHSPKFNLKLSHNNDCRSKPTSYSKLSCCLFN